MNDAEQTAQDREPVTVAGRITVALIPKAAAALAAVTGPDRTRTDAVNRALQAYAFLEEQGAAGCAVLIRQPDGTVSEVRFL